VDLGLSAKVRPCLILSDYPRDDELALVVVIPHTTSLRGNRWEFVCPKSFLKPGAFHLQQIQPVSLPRLQRKLGEVNAVEFRALCAQLSELLNLAGEAGALQVGSMAPER
jgi:mRNA interferase MazF